MVYGIIMTDKNVRLLRKRVLKRCSRDVVEEWVPGILAREEALCIIHACFGDKIRRLHHPVKSRGTCFNVVTLATTDASERLPMPKDRVAFAKFTEILGKEIEYGWYPRY